MEKRELVILGAGPAGLAAAVYGRRADLDTLILEKGAAGGQINITDEIENWPGTIHSTGSELGESFRSSEAAPCRTSKSATATRSSSPTRAR